MDTLEFFIKNGHGKFTSLDKEYQRILLDVVTSDNDKNKERWEVYNMIMGELLHLGAIRAFDEVKYRITDRENPNNIFADIIKKFKSKSVLLGGMERIVNEFIHEDKFGVYYE